MARSLPSLLAVTLALLLGPALAPAAAANPFDDRTAAAGLDLPALPTHVNALVAAISCADVTGDGARDLVTSGGNRPAALYVRVGPLAWAPAASPLPVPTEGGVTHGHTLFDMDGDGDLDLFIARDTVDTLLENTGAGLFLDASHARLPGRAAWTSSAAAGDLDGDGDLDLVLANYVDRAAFPLHTCADNAVLVNDGAGHFTDVTAAWGLSLGTPGCSFVAALTDLDADHALDLLIVNDFAQFSGPQELWLGAGPTPDGAFAFTAAAAARGLVAPVYAMGLALAPADADARLDLVYTNIGAPLLLHADPAGVFSDQTAPRDPGPAYAREGYQVHWTAELADLDNDGWLDLLLAGGHLPAADFIANPDAQASTWLRGTASGRFVEPSPAQQLVPSGIARDLAVVDVDDDGRLDLFIAHVDGRLSFLHNTSLAPPATRLTLVPRATAPNAAGAHLTATCGGHTRARLVSAGRFYGAAADAPTVPITFPAPCNAPGHPVAVALTWPSGYREAFTTTTGAALTRVEPPWLTVSAAALTVDLRDPAAALPAGPLTVTASGALVGPLLEAPPGVFTAALSPAPGARAARLDLALGGVALGAHPRLVWPPATPDPGLATWPAALVAGQPFTVLARPRLAGGAPLPPDAALAVLVDGVPTALLPGPAGDASATLAPPAPDAPAVTLALTVDGAPFGAPEVHPLAPPVDPARTSVDWRDLYIRLVDVPHLTLQARAELRDVNGAIVLPGAADLALAVAGGPTLAPEELFVGSTAVNVRFPHAALADGATVRLLAFGLPIGEPQRVAHLADLAAAAAFVDLTRSTCAFSERALRADGQDRGTALLTVADAHGSHLPLADEQALWTTDGVALAASTPASALGSYRVAVVAGTTPGVATLTLDLAGGPGPVTCALPVAPAPPLPAPSPFYSALTALDEDQVLEAGAPTVLVMVPRNMADRAIGSGFALAAVATQGSLDGAPRYLGHGRYEVVLTPAHAGAVTVTVSSAVPPLTLSATWAVVGDPGGEDAGPGPDADAASGADAAFDADAASGADAASATDADAAPTADAAAAAAADAAPAPDAAPDAHAAPDAAPDAASEAPPDAAPAADPAPAPDAAAALADPPPAGPRRADDGCTASPPTALAPALFALALALWAARRRPRAHPPSVAKRRALR